MDTVMEAEQIESRGGAAVRLPRRLNARWAPERRAAGYERSDERSYGCGKVLILRRSRRLDRGPMRIADRGATVVP